MRRFLTTLMILLVVLVAGLSALVLLVNPNDFRDYMVKQVAARSGYQLQLDGPLRWHVWPQLSILSGRMSLTAQGASQPLVRADNMRLDVALLPLLSHQLSVKQVMLKGAVIQLTPQTEAVRSEDAPVAPRDNTLPDRSAAIISDTIITVVRKIKKASIRGRRTALHINSTIMKVKGHGRYSIESQLNVSVMANVSSDSKSNRGLRWRSR